MWVPKWLKKAMENEFMRLRPFAVAELNPRFNEWNKRYRNKDICEYNKSIQAEERKILDRVNRMHRSGIIVLDADSECDIIARLRYFKKLTLTMELIPYKVEEA
jgi:hypothetical protein